MTSRIRRYALLVGVLLLASACAKARVPPFTPGPPESIPALKLAVLEAVGGQLDYCDPDVYPIAHGSALENATSRLPAIKAQPAVYQAILEHEHIPTGPPLTDAQLIAINSDFKQIMSFELVRSGDAYRFTVYVPTKAAPTYNESISGTVTTTGDVRLESPGPGKLKNCPICLAENVRIATPSGPVSVRSIVPGMIVWSTDGQGRRIEAVVLETGHMLAPVGHEVVRLRLADGRIVVASPGHPTADGRRVGDLRAGDRLDGSRVVSAELVPYTGTTYDLLPSGPTGTYVANGVLLDSTLSSTG